jgi:hypothetical protein
LNKKFINFNLYRKVSVTFEFSKQNFRWKKLNRKNYLKFAQKTEQKQLKLCSVKENREKTTFLSLLAAHSPPVPCAAVCSGRSLARPSRLPAPAPLTAHARCPVRRTQAPALLSGPARDGPRPASERASRPGRRIRSDG